MFVVDSTNFEKVKDLVGKTKVVINFVGPYRLYGETVVKACVEAGTDYVDVTGEPPFVQDIIDTYNDEARQKGLYILPAWYVAPFERRKQYTD